MIGFKINDDFLELPPSFGINFNIKSPLFSFEVIEGDFSYNFTIKNTNTNTRLLGLPQIIENIQLFGDDIDCDLYLNNIFWRASLITIVKAGPDYIQLNFKTSAGEFKSKTADKLMTEIDYDVSGYIPESYKYGLWLIAGTEAADTITFVIGPATHTYNQAHSGKLIDSLQLLADQVNADTPTHGFIAELKSHLPDPDTQEQLAYFYVSKEFSYTIDTTLLNLYYATAECSNYLTPINNDTTHPAAGFEHLIPHMNNLLSWGNYYRDWFTNRQYCFPMYLNYGFASSGVTERFYNKYDAAGLTYDLSDIGEAIAVPMPYIKYLVEKIFEDSGYRLTGSFFLDEEIQSLFLENHFFPDYTVYDGNEFSGDIIDFANHVPEVSCGNFLKALMSAFCLGVFFDPKEKTCEIISWNEVLANTSRKNITAKANPKPTIEFVKSTGFRMAFTNPSDGVLTDYYKELDNYNIKGAVKHEADLPASGNNRGDIYLVLDYNMWYVVDPVGLVSWSNFSANIQPLDILDASTNITTAFSPPVIMRKPYSSIEAGYIDQLLPVVDIVGTSKFFNVQTKLSHLRFCFFRGLVEDFSSNNYPFASTDVYDFDFIKQWNYALKWDGGYGLVASWWIKHFNFFFNTKKVNYNILFNESDLLTHSNKQLFTIDRLTYLIKELAIKFGSKKLEASKTECYSYTTFDYDPDLYNTYSGEEGDEPG